MATATLPLLHGANYTLSTLSWDGVPPAPSPWTSPLSAAQVFAFMPIETTFELNVPTALSEVVAALRPLGRHPVRFVHTGQRDGGHATRGVTVDQAATTYRDQYGLVLAGEPQITSFTLEGQIQTAALGTLSRSVVLRDEIDR